MHLDTVHALVHRLACMHCTLIGCTVLLITSIIAYIHIHIKYNIASRSILTPIFSFHSRLPTLCNTNKFTQASKQTEIAVVQMRREQDTDTSQAKHTCNMITMAGCSRQMTQEVAASNVHSIESITLHPLLVDDGSVSDLSLG